MRYALAAILIVLGLVAAGIGVLQKTLWAPSDTITASAQVGKAGKLVVLEPGMLNLYDPPTTLTVRADGKLSISEAKSHDVHAWVGNTPHTEITGLKSQHTLATKSKSGEGELADPRGDDIWVKQKTGTDKLTMTWDRDAGRTALLIGSDQGKKGSATKVSLSWPSHATTPWAVPLMVIGGVLILFGLLLLSYAIYDSTRRRRRRKARKERHRNAAAPGAAMMAGALVLAGCSGPPELPKPEPSASPTDAQPVVTSGQLGDVLQKIAAATKAGDKSKSVKKLEDRVTGPALKERKAIYKLEKKKVDVDKPTPVAAKPVLLNVTTASDSWPRMTVVVTKGKDADVPQLLDLHQADPRSPYKLWSSVDLLPGAEIPSTPSAKTGSQLLPPEEPGLLVTPRNAAKHYADILEHGKKSKHFKEFKSDAFTKKLLKHQSKQKKSVKDANAKVKFKHKVNEKALVATRTAKGGALVLAHLTSGMTIKPENVDGRTGKIKLPDVLAKLLDEKTTHSGVKTSYRETVLFYVPKGYHLPKGPSSKVRVLGVDNVLVGGKEL